jgi:hypothetical protein
LVGFPRGIDAWLWRSEGLKLRLIDKQKGFLEESFAEGRKWWIIELQAFVVVASIEVKNTKSLQHA